MATLQDILDRHQMTPITSQCYKELGQTIQNHSQPELQNVVESLVPTNIQQQLLQLTTARLTGCLGPLEDGLKSECKYVSEFCLKSDVLFSSSKTRLLDVNFLLPLLQAVSSSTRNRILWNLGKHMSTSSDPNFTVDKVDSLYYDVVKVWGSRIAVPLLCQTSKTVLAHELQCYCRQMSKCHMFIIAKRFPDLVLSVMENHSYFPPCNIARYVVRLTIPQSLDYIAKRKPQLSKSTMKIILQNHTNVVLADPVSWGIILDSKLVKRTLKPEKFTSFVTKQMLELTYSQVPYTLMSYLKLLSPSELSSLIINIFQVKYGCSLQEKLDYWEKNSDLLKLLEPSDRSCIAVELNIKNKLSIEWVPLMTCDKSIPKLKHLLSSEQSASERASLVNKLVETAIINKDQYALEDICKFVVVRYRNDKLVLHQFFNTSIDFLSLSDETWTVVFDAAKKFFDPDDWQTRGATQLYVDAIKRDGLSALKEYLNWWMKYHYHFPASNLADLDTNLHQACVNEVFTEVNINNKEKLIELAEFLQLVTKWAAKSNTPIINDNVKKCVLKLMESTSYGSRMGLEFVLANRKTLDIHFIEDCFQAVVDPSLISYLLSKDASIIYSKETAERVGSHILESGVGGYVKLLMKLRRQGFTNILQCIATKSQAALAADGDNVNMRKVKTAVVLMMLTADCQVFFSVVDPMLPSITNGTVIIPGQEIPFAVNSPIKLSNHQEAIYQGFGWSLSHAELPLMAYERLLHFCVTSDLVLFVRDALYSLCSSVPNENAEKMLTSLMEQPVSVKKHSLRLLKVVCNIATQEVMLEKLIATEKHLTMRTILMHFVITLLNETKSTNIWLVLKHMVDNLTPDDKTIVLEIVSETIPDQFIEEYLHILLGKSKELTDVDHPQVISSILQQVNKFVTHMSEKFTECLIVEYFMSEIFFENLNSHGSISSLLIKYLQGLPASSLQVGQSVNQGLSVSTGPQRSLDERQHFLNERLNATIVKGALNAYDAKNGIYPLQKLLMMFIEEFCTTCVNCYFKDQKIQLMEYIDTLLTYFGKFNPSAIFSPFILVSLTKIFKMTTGSSFVLGEEMGKFCDLMTQQSTAPLYCYNIPNAVSNFMDMLTLSSTNELIDVLRGILAFTYTSTKVSGDGSCHDMQSMFRLMVVAHILPSKWQVKEEFKDFREMFLVLIKNTPVEVFVFNEN